MPTKFKLKVTKVGNSFRITIPREIMDQMSLHQGDVVSLWASDDKGCGRIIIEKLKET